MRAPKWTKEEEAIVARFFPKYRRRQFVNWKKLLPLLNNRTRAATLHHMRMLRTKGKVSGSLGPTGWTNAEVRYLTSVWQIEAPRTIILRMRKRNWKAILLKARELGLGTAVPQGHLSTTQMAKHLGVDHTVVSRIAHFGRIKRHVHYGACVSWSNADANRWLYWPIDEMEEACKRWFEYAKVGPLITSVAHDLRRTPEWVLDALKALNVEVEDPAYFRVSPELKARLKEYRQVCHSDSSPATR